MFRSLKKQGYCRRSVLAFPGALRAQRNAVVLCGIGRQPISWLSHSGLDRVTAVRAGRDGRTLLNAGLVGTDTHSGDHLAESLDAVFDIQLNRHP